MLILAFKLLYLEKKSRQKDWKPLYWFKIPFQSWYSPLSHEKLLRDYIFLYFGLIIANPWESHILG